MILDKIVIATKMRVERLKLETPFEEKKKAAEDVARDQWQGEGGFKFPFKKALAKEGISFICEIKKASPSKGLISPAFPYRQVAIEYENSGAGAISVLTEPDFFQGLDQYLSEVVELVKIPVLRKDFTVDPYQIYEAKVMGASAILLICAILSDEQLKSFLGIAKGLGLDALVETHNQEEIERAIIAGADIIGVNNRDLKTFQVDLENSISLRKSVPQSILFVAESGIKSREDILKLENAGVDGVLIGETLMASPNIKKTLDRLRG